MRIALITTSFLPKIGGAEQAVHGLATAWSGQGHEVCVLNAVADGPVAAGARYGVRRYAMLRGSTRFGAHRWPFRPWAARQLARFLDEYRPDFVSAHFGYPVAPWLASLRPVPRYWITCHGPALNETPTGPRQRFGFSDGLARALGTAERVVAISTHARRILVRIGVDPQRIVLIYNGVDTARFRREVRHDVRAELGVPRGALLVLSVGREVWAKDYRTGIAAFARMARDRPNAFYLVVGRGTSVWRRLAAEQGVAERVIFSEGLYDDRLVAAYRQSDVFLLPSVKELCPLVVVEAMAAGLPCVVTDVSGSQDLVRSGSNGYVVPPGDDQAMGAALSTLADDAALRRAQGRVSHDLAPAYDWERVSRMHLGDPSVGLGFDDPTSEAPPAGRALGLPCR